MLLQLHVNSFLKKSFNIHSAMSILLIPYHLLRPRKQTQRVDRCRTKKQYKNRRHFRGYYYRWMGSY
ncbi:conserved Plasmodium protein, unknown function [Plasmodium malariae]|uniref:Uncharacterized protein n=1 Tax=Plasmodium malariae TaxID=5858 RepID=A0A1C3L343_PLAMA|nr:conserved Plasmodium protein, unknown function [Plasmodium malariae]SBT80996.1 conserved Plasmodium protein, unknown function [Plasmodium malariae]SCP03600.1 conserved Plasmodium protein, unknown function [Plasmodium malariae]